MIISGGARCNWRFFAKHLMKTEENERVKIAEIRGLAGDTTLDALREMDAVARGTRCKNFFYHANLNPREDEQLSPEQWEQAVDTLEGKLGLDGQSRIVVEHEKLGRTHRHVIWSRIDPDRLTAISDSHNYAKHEAAARELEQQFALAPVQGVHVGREGPRPERRPANWETFRGHKSGIDPKDVKAEVTELWQSSDSGVAFRTALAQRGYVMAQGDRRDFLIIDSAGQEHSLARRIEGAKAAEIRARLADIDREDLPRVSHGRTERREDKQRVAATVESGADKRRVEAAINTARASAVLPQEPTEDLPERQGRQSYDDAALRQKRPARRLTRTEIEEHPQRTNEPERER
jgi:hypothetical protein